MPLMKATTLLAPMNSSIAALHRFGILGANSTGQFCGGKPAENLFLAVLLALNGSILIQDRAKAPLHDWQACGRGHGRRAGWSRAAAAARGAVAAPQHPPQLRLQPRARIRRGACSGRKRGSVAASRRCLRLKKACRTGPPTTARRPPPLTLAQRLRAADRPGAAPGAAGWPAGRCQGCRGPAGAAPSHARQGLPYNSLGRHGAKYGRSALHKGRLTRPGSPFGGRPAWGPMQRRPWPQSTSRHVGH